MMAAESERKFIGNILADDSSDYDQESPRDKIPPSEPKVDKTVD